MSKNKYILGDCMEYLKEYEDNHFDLAIVDPPYGIGIASKGVLGKSKFKPKSWDNKSPGKKYFKGIFRVSKNQIIWGCNFFNTPLVGGRIVWNKLGIYTNKKKQAPTLSDCEIAYHSFGKRCKMFSYAYMGNVIGNGYIITKKHRIHPTQKPVALYRWLLQNYAKPNDLILDTHVGSASSLIACEIEGFNYVGFEKDSDYYRDSTKRINQHLAQMTMF